MAAYSRLWLSLLVLALAPAAAPGKAIEERYPSGKLKSQFTVNDQGVRWGPYTLYDQAGRKREAGEYRDGKLHGNRQAFDESGKLTHSAEYRQGKVNGVARTFKDGKLVEEQGYVDGQLVYPRSPAVIAAEVRRIRGLRIPTVDRPGPIPAHDGGNDSQEGREDAVRLLMEYRYLSNVPYEPMELDPLYNACTEAAVALLATIGRLDHNPSNPGWPADKYEFARKGAANSNLYMGPGGAVRAVRAYMGDSDPKNIERLGHRRWCLFPRIGRLGVATRKGYTAMYVFDTSRRNWADFDHIAYPAAGYFPTTHFDDRDAWSVSVNPARYARPDGEAVKVTIRPARVDLANGRIETADPLELDHFSVDRNGFGIDNCIIFRPARLDMRPGAAYQVRIEGLVAKDGTPAPIEYLTEFYRP